MLGSEKYTTFIQCIGNTPLAKIDLGINATTLAKLEFLNPGGSIKDRAALFMINEAERRGLLKPGGTIVEASSGNQGIALAMIGAQKGYDVIITVPDRTSFEKMSTLQAYGAKVYVCPDTDDLHDAEGYHGKAIELSKKILGAYMPNQYYNLENPNAHYSTTGPEIWEQTKGELTHCFVPMGSCGAITGIGRYLKEKNANIKIIGIDAATSNLSTNGCPKKYKSEGIGVDVISDTLDRSVIDEIVPIGDDEIFDTTRKLAKKGLLIGLSSGAVARVVMDYAPKLKSNDVAVMIFADSGRAYLRKLFNL